MEASMKNPETVAEILRRAEILQRGKQRRARHLSAALSAGVSVVAITLFIRLWPLVKSGEEINSALGSTELYFNGSVAGSYVLTGVICFTLGVAVTLLCIRAKGRKDAKPYCAAHSRDAPRQGGRDNGNPDCEPPPR